MKSHEWPPVTGEAILQEARKWIDVPYHHDGRSREGGVDCAGLFAVVLGALGVDVIDRRGVSRDDVYEAMLATFALHAERVGHGLLTAEAMLGESEWEGPKAGDALVFRGRAMPNHVAIATGNGRMIHAYSSVGKVLEQPIGPAWIGRCSGVWRYKGSL
ncbi:hypothetical protein EON79_04125 [bacterium]|nr:MAG: hypothetical protein EON79_04125 [bacterium]